MRIDDTHIKMVMAEPNSSTLESVGFFVFYVSPKALDNAYSLNDATCGTGPFQLTEFENNAYAIYSKNENYWQEGLPYLDTVEITVVTESSTGYTAFRANEYDMFWIGLTSPTIQQELSSDSTFVKEDNRNGMGIATLGLIPNSAIDSLWADAKVRRAMCYAIDCDALNAAFRLDRSPTTTISTTTPMTRSGPRNCWPKQAMQTDLIPRLRPSVRIRICLQQWRICWPRSVFAVRSSRWTERPRIKFTRTAPGRG